MSDMPAIAGIGISYVLVGDEQIEPGNRRYTDQRQQNDEALASQNVRRRETHARGLGRPRERREMAVVPFAHHVEIEFEAVHVELRPAPCQGKTPAGGMCRVVDIERLATAIARWHPFDLE